MRSPYSNLKKLFVKSNPLERGLLDAVKRERANGGMTGVMAWLKEQRGDEMVVASRTRKNRYKAMVCSIGT